MLLVKKDTFTLETTSRLVKAADVAVVAQVDEVMKAAREEGYEKGLQDGKTEITFRNVSRDELNVSAEELMERFVRGDASRNSEGSGLGLSIAKSLTELNNGTLSLTVDGDLFKATLVFQRNE